MKKRAMWLAFLGVLCLGPGLARGIDLGPPAPAFHLVSGDGQELSRDDLKGKIAVIIYETRDTVEQNRAFKNELADLLAQSGSVRNATLVVAAINCVSAAWPTKAIWESKLRENSAKEKMTIYGDWDGKMAADYKMTNDVSNVVIVDQQGAIRYRRAGKLDADAIRAVRALLVQVASE